MNTYNYSPIVLSLFVATGCATNHFDRNEKFSSAGTDYTESVSNLLDITESKIIEVNTQLLLIAPASTEKSRQEILIKHNKALALLLTEMDQYRRHNDLLGRYFKELEIVSNAGKESDTGITLGKLSHTIANLNQEMATEYQVTVKPRMSENQKGHIGNLANQLLKTHYAKNIQRQLLRDSPIIATQLELQSKQLDELIELMRGTLEMGRILHKKKLVMEPYVKGQFNNQAFASWPSNRAKLFELRHTEKVFEAVKEAQEAMSWAWQDIVRGKRDISSVNNALNDVNGFVKAMSSFKTNTPVSDDSRIPIQ